MTERKGSIQFNKIDDLYSWCVYNADGEIIARSTASHQRKVDAEQDAANTMIAIVEGAISALTQEKALGVLKHMKPVVEAIIRSSGIAVEMMREMGYYHERGLTQKGTELVRSNEQARQEKLQAELEVSKALPGMSATMHIPIKYENSTADVRVRLK